MQGSCVEMICVASRFSFQVPPYIIDGESKITSNSLQYSIIIIVIPLIGEGQHCPIASEYLDSLHHELYEDKLKHTMACQGEHLLSSTSPHLSIWLFTSTVAAREACSTLKCFVTKARPIISDFDAYVARSRAL
jgi:hypothetical protein